MGNTRKAIALACAVLLVGSLTVGCSNSQSTKTDGSTASETTTELSIMVPDGGRILKPDTENPPLAELEKETNTKLNINLVPSGSYNDKLNVMAGSGSLADITQITGDNTYQPYVDQGLFLDIGSLLDKYGTNLKKLYSKDAWNTIKYKGKYYVIPYENVPGKVILSFRSDWLKNLGLSVPTTLAEYKNVLEKFTTGDPDKDGKNDTYGLGASGNWSDTASQRDFDAILGAYGIGWDVNFVKDNKVYNAMISDQYRQAVEFIHGLWEEKVIDPEIFTIKEDQAEQKLVQNKAGTLTAWWSIAPAHLIQKWHMDQTTPGADWVPITAPITGSDGQGGMLSNGNIGATIAISDKSKQSAAAVKFLDYLATDKGGMLANFGIQGVEYTSMGQWTDQGLKEFNAKWLDPLSQTIIRNDLQTKWQQATNDPNQKQNNVFINAAAKMKLYSDLFYGLPMTDEYKTYGADLEKFEIQSFISFVTGTTALTDSSWNTYVNTYKNSKSGQKIIDANIKEYNSLKSTKYTAGN